MKEDFKNILLILSIVIGFILIVLPHLYFVGPYITPNNGERLDGPLILYNFPFHFDEFDHISIAKNMVNDKTLESKNPYFVEKPNHKDLEKGYHVILGVIDIITFRNLENIAFILPGIFFLISSLGLFLVIKDKVATSFAVIFFATLPNNMNILGNWFLVPVIGSISLLFFTIYLSEKETYKRRTSKPKINNQNNNNSKQNKYNNYKNYSLYKETILKYNIKKTILLFALIILALFIYPLIAVWMVLYLAIKLIFDLKLYRREFITKYLFLLIVIPTAFILIFFKTNIYKLFIFTKGWTSIEHLFSIVNLFNPLLFFFAILGLIFLWKHKQYKIATFLSLSTIFIFINMILFKYFEFTFLIPYQRTIYYLGIFMILFSGFGIKELQNIKISNKHLFLKTISEWFKKHKHISTTIVILLCLLILIPPSITVSPERFSLHKVVDEDLILFLRTIPSEQIILANPFISSTIYPLTGNYILDKYSTNLPGGYLNTYNSFVKVTNIKPKEPGTIYYSFLKLDCNKKVEFLKETKTTILITEKNLNCEELKIIFEKENLLVFSFSS